MVQESGCRIRSTAFGKLGLVTGDAELFRRGAELGDGVSMTELGRIAKDEAEAARWYRKAAEAGDPSGMERYAYFAENGLGGTDQSFGEAIVWYKKAAEAGSPAALTRMGILTGDKKFLKRAVDVGYAPAMTALAKVQPEDAKQLYECGGGTRRTRGALPCGQSPGVGSARISARR